MRVRLLREIFLVSVGYLVYSQVRGLAGDRVVEALLNGYRVVELEEDLGIFKERALQGFILPHDLLVQTFNFIYFYGLFPLLIPTAAFLFLRRPDVYLLTRNAFFASGAIAVVFFLLIPTAPPRLLALGLVDTLGGSNFAPTYESIPGVNHFAAVPSMHVGWNFLTTLAIGLAISGPVRWLLPLLPIAMFVATVVTGHHYIVDGVLGIAVALSGLAVALFVRQQLQAGPAVVQAPQAS